MATLFHTDCALLYLFIQCFLLIFLQMTAPTHAFPTRQRAVRSNHEEQVHISPEVSFLAAADDDGAAPHLIRRMRSLRGDTLTSILEDVISHSELSKSRSSSRPSQPKKRHGPPHTRPLAPSGGGTRVPKGDWERSGWGGGYGR